MGIRNLLRNTLTAAVLAYSANNAQAQEAKISVESKQYQVTKDKRILDEKGNIVTNQIILSRVIQAYLINQELKNYKPTAEQNLRELNRSKTQVQLDELLERYSSILKTPVEKIKESLKEKDLTLFGSIKRSLTIGKELYRGTKDVLVSIYIDPKMYLYGDITSNLTQAEKDYSRFIQLLDEPIDYRKTAEALELLVESEYIIKAAAQSFKEVNSSENKELEINEEEKERFTQLLDLKDTKENIQLRQEVCDKVRSRARKTKEAGNYRSLLQQEKIRLLRFKQNLLTNISQRFYSS